MPPKCWHILREDEPVCAPAEDSADAGDAGKSPAVMGRPRRACGQGLLGRPPVYGLAVLSYAKKVTTRNQSQQPAVETTGCEKAVNLSLPRASNYTESNEMSGQQKRQDFAEVVDVYYEKILRGALSVARDQHLAEEIVQETFLTAFKKFDSFAGRSSVFTWLYRIMLNNYSNHCRKKNLLRRLGFVRVGDSASRNRNALGTASSPAAELVAAEEREVLMQAVDGLPAKLRVVVGMHYFDGLPLRDIAEILNCRPGTVKSRLFNARKRLCETVQGKLRYEQGNEMPRG